MTSTAVVRTSPVAAPGRAPAAPAPPPVPRAAPEEAIRVLLETARAVLERGWLQHGWYETAPRPLRERLFGPIPAPEQIERACLVAAVAVAGHSGGAFTRIDQDSGPALDATWNALQEQHGRPDPGRGAVAPIVRRARMRELVHWNDAAGRTRAEVLGLLDRAISRTIMDQVRPAS